MNIIKLIQRVNLLEAKLKTLEEHFGVKVVWQPGEFGIKPIPQQGNIIKGNTTTLVDNSQNDG